MSLKPRVHPFEAKIKELEGLPPEQQVLIFRGPWAEFGPAFNGNLKEDPYLGGLGRLT